jgi:5'-3' exonuclease
MNNILVLDMSNILYKTFYVHSRETDHDLIRKLAYNTSLTTLNKYYNSLKPVRMAFVFDRANWRAEYTKSEQCYSRKLYKGHRRQQMKPAEQVMYDNFKQFVLEFEQLIRDCTGITCLAADGLEADDLIAGICRIYGGEDSSGDNRSTNKYTVDDHSVAIVSADKDMLQLLRYDRVILIDPANGKQRTIENNEIESIDFFLYHKYLRGDRGDNVQSALPRIRTKKIQEAFEDGYTHTNLMNTEWIHMDERVMLVGDIVTENKLLMNLTHQPAHIQELMWDTIDSEFNKQKSFNQFKFMKFLGQNELKNVSRYLDSYIPMLSSR